MFLQWPKDKPAKPHSFKLRGIGWTRKDKSKDKAKSKRKRKITQASRRRNR